MRGGRTLGLAVFAVGALASLSAYPASATGEDTIDTSIDGTPAPAERLRNALTVMPIDCLPDDRAATLNQRLRDRLGPLQGFDNPKIIPLADGRTLWLLSDPYVDLTSIGEPPLPQSDYIHNALLVQDGLCFSLVQRSAGGYPLPLVSDLPDGDFFWPLGGTEGNDGRVYVFWSRMDEDGLQAPEDGITRHPVSTWLGVYDATTLRELQLAPAPNSGVHPQYGSAVQTAGAYTYLFGNSNMLELSREGGFWKGTPFSGTRMYLARVPAGQLLAAPQYFTGGGWSSLASSAAPFSSRWYLSNAMQPRVIDGTWYSVVKKDEFWGDRVIVEAASRPQGPWTTISDEYAGAEVPADRSDTAMTTYQPVLLPARAADGTLTVVLSQNAATWLESLADPRLYRPQAFAVAG